MWNKRRLVYIVMRIRIIKEEIKALIQFIDAKPSEQDKYLLTQNKASLISLVRQLCGYIEAREYLIKELRKKVKDER